MPDDARELVDVDVYVVPGLTANVRQVKIAGPLRGGRFVPPKGHIVDFEGAHVVDVDFGNSTFYALRSVGSLFEGCDFSRCKIETGHFYGRQTVFRRCRFERADLRRLRPDTARFERCDFDHTNLDGWIASRTEFVECRFAGRIRDVSFSGSLDADDINGLDPPRTVNEFRCNDFSQAELVGVDFRSGIDLNQQLLPGEPDHIRLDRIEERISRALALVSMWPSSRERDELKQGLEVKALVYDGHEEALVHRSEFKDPLESRLLELLIEALPGKESQSSE